MSRKQFFGKKARTLYTGAWILLFIISIWLYINEGRYLHLFVMDIATMGDEFEVSVWSGEKHAVVFSRENTAEIETEQFNLQNEGQELLHSEAIFNLHAGICWMIIYMGILVAEMYLLQIVFAIQNTKILTK